MKTDSWTVLLVGHSSSSVPWREQTTAIGRRPVCLPRPTPTGERVKDTLVTMLSGSLLQKLFPFLTEPTNPDLRRLSIKLAVLLSVLSFKVRRSLNYVLLYETHNSKICFYRRTRKSRRISVTVLAISQLQNAFPFPMEPTNRHKRQYRLG